MLASCGIFWQRFTLPPPVAHMDMPGFRLHPLRGRMKGFWAVTVRANWRVIFRFDDGAEDVDYVDYH
jgi:proteic killer suppression protein